MRNLVSHRSMSVKMCIRLVEILDLHVTITRNVCQFLLYAVIGKKLDIISQIVRW